MNATAAVIFVIDGVVAWQYLTVMVPASLIGGYEGARFAKKLPAAYVRAIVITIGFGVAAYAFYKRSQAA
jgi:uncharacterized membrane protein YfcA